MIMYDLLKLKEIPPGILGDSPLLWDWILLKNKLQFVISSYGLPDAKLRTRRPITETHQNLKPISQFLLQEFRVEKK